MDRSWTRRPVDRLIGYSGVPIFILGMVGMGIMFQHYAHRASGWIYYAVLLGYLAFLAGMIYPTIGTRTDQSRATRPLLLASIFFVIAVVALGLGLFARRAMAETPQRADYTFAIGILLSLGMAVYGTLLGIYLTWRQWRNGV